MEDYGMEKRLRDVTVLKSAAGSATYTQTINLRYREGGPAMTQSVEVRIEKLKMKNATEMLNIFGRLTR